MIISFERIFDKSHFQQALADTSVKLASKRLVERARENLAKKRAAEAAREQGLDPGAQFTESQRASQAGAMHKKSSQVRKREAAKNEATANSPSAIPVADELA